MLKTNEWTILKVLSWTTAYFKSHNIESPRACAEILLAHALNIERIELYLYYDKPLSDVELAEFKKLIKRRKEFEPVAYIVGCKEFWSIKLSVSKDVLIPRPETEILVETALRQIKKKENKTDIPIRIIELGTGSGAITAALASSALRHDYFASDKSEQALAVAKKNTLSLKLRISFFMADWFTSLSRKEEHKFDIIISNPPYISTGEIENLQPEISLYEPKRALDGGKDGLEHIRNIINNAWHHLKENGFLLLEIGFDQKEKVSKLVNNTKQYRNIEFLKDYGGHDRVVSMTKKPDKS